jgi:hypothetical protein
MASPPFLVDIKFGSQVGGGSRSRKGDTLVEMLQGIQFEEDEVDDLLYE